MDFNSFIQKSKEGDIVLNETFNVGDHVVKGKHYKQYGVVHSTSKNTAKIKWENGKESTHNHSGEERGNRFGERVWHTEVNGKRVTNDEHKAHLESGAADEAHKQGLHSAGAGYWKNSAGKVVAKTESGKLVRVDHSDEKLNEKPKGDYRQWAMHSHERAAETHKTIAEHPDVDADKETHKKLAAAHAAKAQALKDEVEEHDHGREHGHDQDRRLRDGAYNINSTSLQRVHDEHLSEAEKHKEAAAHHDAKHKETGSAKHANTAAAHREAAENHEAIAHALKPALKLRKNMGIEN